MSGSWVEGWIVLVGFSFIWFTVGPFWMGRFLFFGGFCKWAFSYYEKSRRVILFCELASLGFGRFGKLRGPLFPRRGYGSLWSFSGGWVCGGSLVDRLAFSRRTVILDRLPFSI